MAQLTSTLNIPDDKVEDMHDTLASAFGYSETITENGNQVANPVTKQEFIEQKANEHMREWIRNTYKCEKERQLLLNHPTNTIDL